MSVFTSERFASVAAAGSDWRDAARQVLAALEHHLKGDPGYNIGFLYITDYLAPEAESLLSLMRSVTKIDKWVGTVGVGVCGTDGGYIDEPAIAVLLGRIGPDDFHIFAENNVAAIRAGMDPWLE
jgi:hypothetical protein